MRLRVASIDPWGSSVGKYTSSLNCKSNLSETIHILECHHKKDNKNIKILTLTIEGFSFVERFTGKKWIFGILRWIDATSGNLNMSKESDHGKNHTKKKSEDHVDRYDDGTFSVQRFP